MLGRALHPTEDFPNQEVFNKIVEIINYQATTHFVFEKSQVDEESINYLDESIQVRLAEIQLRNERIYNRALKGDKVAFEKVCSWGEHIDESNTEFFGPGDKEFFDESDDANASPEGQKRFERIMIGIYSILGQKELESNPEYLVWKLANQKDRTTEEITQKLLNRLRKSRAQLERVWDLSRSPSIHPLPLDMTLRDQAEIQVWENGYAQLQQEGTQITEESKKLYWIVSEYPYEQATKALTQHTKKNFFYGIIGSVQRCLQGAKDSTDAVLRLLGNEKHFLTDMMKCMGEKEAMIDIEDEPHMKAQWEIIEKIWEHVSNDKLDLQLQAPEIFALAQKVSAYRLHKDLNYSQGLVKFWWDKRPNAAFFQGEKRDEDDSLFHRFLNAGLQMNFPHAKSILKVLWNAHQLESEEGSQSKYI